MFAIIVPGPVPLLPGKKPASMEVTEENLSEVAEEPSPIILVRE
jgi:hypothetical protein